MVARRQRRPRGSFSSTSSSHNEDTPQPASAHEPLLAAIASRSLACTSSPSRSSTRGLRGADQGNRPAEKFSAERLSFDGRRATAQLRHRSCTLLRLHLVALTRRSISLALLQLRRSTLLLRTCRRRPRGSARRATRTGSGRVCTDGRAGLREDGVRLRSAAHAAPRVDRERAQGAWHDLCPALGPKGEQSEPESWRRSLAHGPSLDRPSPCLLTASLPFLRTSLARPATSNDRCDKSQLLLASFSSTKGRTLSLSLRSSTRPTEPASRLPRRRRPSTSSRLRPFRPSQLSQCTTARREEGESVLATRGTAESQTMSLSTMRADGSAGNRHFARSAA